jgi:GNAT superfamily N-acetyltransferase
MNADYALVPSGYICSMSSGASGLMEPSDLMAPSGTMISSGPMVSSGKTKSNASETDQQEYAERGTLSDGTQVFFRLIGSHDKSTLSAFHNRLSEETRFQRYHYLKGDLTEQDLKDLCDVDYITTLAIVAEIQRNGHREIIGVGRFIRLSFDHTAEVAFVVQDSEQNKGLGTQLLKQLSKLAWQRGIFYFFGEVLRNNGKMLTVFRRADPNMKQEIDSACTCTVTLSVAEAMQR